MFWKNLKIIQIKASWRVFYDFSLQQLHELHALRGSGGCLAALHEVILLAPSVYGGSRVYSPHSHVIHVIDVMEALEC